MLGAQRARRAMASRLADAVAHVVGGVGVTLTITVQDGAADPKSGSVPFSTWVYCSWGAPFIAQAPEDQERIAMAHFSESISGIQKQQAQLREKFLAEKDKPKEGAN